MNIFINNSIKNSIIVKNFLNNYTPKNIVYFDFLEQLKNVDSNNNLVFTENKGKFIKRCPCTSNVLGCGYYVIDLIQNCPFDCSYCYLKFYSNFSYINIYANIDKLFSELYELDKNLNRKIRIGTGEFSDSLTFDNYTNYTGLLIKEIQKYKNFILEIKSKSDNIQHLLNNSHKNIVFSWSLNPQEIIDIDEKFTVSLEQRLNAAKLSINSQSTLSNPEKQFNRESDDLLKDCTNYYTGKTAFHFDPIIPIKNWQEKYISVFNQLEKLFSNEDIAWISLGIFRTHPSLINIIRAENPDSYIFNCELIKGNDGKLRVIRPLREKIYSFFVEHLENFIDRKKIYLCMENSELWEAANLTPEYLIH